MQTRELKSTDTEAFEQVLRVLRSRFDTSCLEPRAQLEEEFRGEHRLKTRFAVVEEEGRVLAAARYLVLPDIGFSTLIHIATDRERQGSGAGGALLRHVIDRTAPYPMILETEDDREDGPASVYGWYLRHGAELVSGTYTQPALGEGLDPVPFQLLAIRAPAGRGEREALVQRFYAGMWELERYHPLVLHALEGVPG